MNRNGSTRHRQSDQTLAQKGLPSNLDAERFILGSVLLDGSRFPEIATIPLSDFTTEAHRRIYSGICDLHGRGEKVDRVTVADELMRHGELESVGGLSYLVTLDDGLPHVASLDSYIRIVSQKAALRRLVYIGDHLKNRALMAEDDPQKILAGVQDALAGLSDGRAASTVIDDLPAVRACGAADIEYLRKPELPRGAVVALTGDSASGKSTLALAWARDAGVPVLVLDRENPVSVIIDRLDRIGFADCPRLRYWGAWLPQEPPMPDAVPVLDWVRSSDPKPLVICDSLSAFHGGDQNDAGEMRRMMQRCRRLADLGATVIVIHHDGKSETAKDYRGSSDFKAAVDLAFHVSNFGPTGLLDKLLLRPWKTRIPCPAELGYLYAGGRFIRAEEPEVRQSVTEQLSVILRLNPGITASRFDALAAEQQLSRTRARQFLLDGVVSGAVRLKSGSRNNEKRYFLGPEDGNA